MVAADGEGVRRRPRLDLLVRAMGEDPVRETLDVSGEDWESILSGGMELDETLLARLETMIEAMVRTGNSTVGLGRPSVVVVDDNPLGMAPGPAALGVVAGGHGPASKTLPGLLHHRKTSSPILWPKLCRVRSLVR